MDNYIIFAMIVFWIILKSTMDKVLIFLILSKNKWIILKKLLYIPIPFSSRNI